MQGTVKWFSNSKGYGFLSGEDGVDYFAHWSGLADDNALRDERGHKYLLDGESVVFDFERLNGSKGPAAYNVTRLGPSSWEATS